MTQKFVTASGEEHGLVKEVANSVADTGFGRFAEKDRSKMEKLKKHQLKLVKARYINYRGPNERLDTTFCQWPGETLKTYHLIPNHVYELPMGLIEQINNNSGLARRSEVLDANGVPTKKDGAAERIHELVPISFAKDEAA